MAPKRTRKGTAKLANTTVPKKKPRTAKVEVVGSEVDQRRAELEARDGGVLLTFGSGDIAQLGHGMAHNMRERKFPTVVEALRGEKMVQVSCGGVHTCAVSNDGKLWSWGCNDDGALGRAIVEEEDEWIPKRVEVLDKEFVVKVCCGSSHTIALTLSGDVYTFGTYRNEGGIFGYSATEKRSKIPQKVKELSNVIDIACGEDVDIALTAKHEVYVWGDINNDKRVSERFKWRKLSPNLVSFKKDGPYKKPKVTKIFGGGYSIFAIAEDGRVWAWGPNNYCQLGFPLKGEDFWQKSPKVIAFLADKKIVDLDCAIHHTIAVDEDGKVYTFGRGGCGRLGHGDETQRNEPTLVEGVTDASDKCIGVGAGEVHSLVVTESGKLFTFGNGDLLQCGNGVECDLLLPHHVHGSQLAKYKRKALQTSAGSQHSAVIATVGTVPPEGEILPETEDSVIAEMEEDEEDYLDRLRVFYKKYNPEKLDTVMDTLGKYKGNEEVLFERLMSKYCPEELAAQKAKKKAASAAAASPAATTTTPTPASAPTPVHMVPPTVTPTPVSAPPSISAPASPPVTSAPVPVASVPEQVVSAPAPVVSAPAPVVSAPAPVVSAPVPVVSAPAPVVSAPVPVVSAPAPVVSAVTASAPVSAPFAAPAAVDYRGRLIRFYSKYAPNLLPTVDKVLPAFAGRETVFFEKLLQKYPGSSFD